MCILAIHQFLIMTEIIWGFILITLLLGLYVLPTLRCLMFEVVRFLLSVRIMFDSSLENKLVLIKSIGKPTWS